MSASVSDLAPPTVPNVHSAGTVCVPQSASDWGYLIIHTHPCVNVTVNSKC